MCLVVISGSKALANLFRIVVFFKSLAERHLNHVKTPNE